jgi:hypothetical protein
VTVKLTPAPVGPVYVRPAQTKETPQVPGGYKGEVPY